MEPNTTNYTFKVGDIVQGIQGNVWIRGKIVKEPQSTMHGAAYLMEVIEYKSPSGGLYLHGGDGTVSGNNHRWLYVTDEFGLDKNIIVSSILKDL